MGAGPDAEASLPVAFPGEERHLQRLCQLGLAGAPPLPVRRPCLCAVASGSVTLSQWEWSPFSGVEWTSILEAGS